MSDCCETPNPRFSKKTWTVLGIWVAVFAVSFLPFFAKLNASFLSYLSLIWWAIILGFFIGGVVDYLVPDGFIVKYLGQRKKRSLFFAVIAGFLLSACSHGILALAIQLYKKGASTSSVITFLMASPWANLPVTILLFGFFGLQALWFIGAAMVIALITGAVFMLLESFGWVESNQKEISVKKYTWKLGTLSEFTKGVYRGAVSLADMVLWWILAGFLAAVVIGAYVPSHIFMQYFGPTFTGLLLTLAFATIIEVCSEGSSPIAFEIFRQVGTLGNPFVFLMAGVATDYTEIGLIWTNIGKRAAIWLPVIAVPQIVIVGLLFNTFL
ncbi:MAG: uncharacterized membrane protein YraQ (UPF0718 family) [Candidatus Woesearchaeota archaeon]|jgi:uncharacterized membrane protein YraQ (UPF0718 family)